MMIEKHTARHAAEYLRSALNAPGNTAMDALVAATKHITVPCRAIGIAKKAIVKFEALGDRREVLIASIGYMEAACNFKGV